MRTLLTTLSTLGACTAARWYLDRSSRADTEYAGGRVRMTSVWNQGAAFGLHIRKDLLLGASFAVLGAVWTRRREHPVSAGLVLGGGISNLAERLGHGRVYDYVQFPRAPGKVKQYVFNLADFSILLGSAGLGLGRKKKS